MLTYEDFENKNLAEHITERYRVICNSIVHLDGFDEAKVISFIDTDSKEKKENIVINLGIVISELYNKKVLIIDADYERAILHRLFGMDKMDGFYDVLVNDIKFKSTIHNIDKDKIFLQQCGNTGYNSIIMDNLKIDAILKYAKSNYDIVLINSPTYIFDVQTFSAHSDCSLIISDFGRAKMDRINEYKNSINNINANILGVIIVNN